MDEGDHSVDLQSPPPGIAIEKPQLKASHTMSGSSNIVSQGITSCQDLEIYLSTKPSRGLRLHSVPLEEGN
jgi:hypothetical protein